MRRRLQLRVQQHAVVADADAAADGGKQPARRLRAAVRIERQHRCARARVAPAPGPEHSRFGDRAREAASAEARRRRTTRKLSDYLESLRDVERRIQKAEEQSTKQGPERGSAGRCPGRVRAARAAALRPAGAGLPVRSDAGDHVHVRPRADRPAVSADRHPRAASSADAPSERPGEDGEVHRRSSSITSRCSRRIWRNCGRRRTATGRCSIT